jgi:1,4-dihydroxy-2-naphthoate octaprenyltransferase
VIGVASVLCGIAYTGGPWPLGYHGLGDVFVFLFFGLVAVGATAFVQTGQLTREVLLAAVPIGLLSANILVAKNYRDVETDRVAGKRTLVACASGRRFARAQFNLSLLAAFVIPFLIAAPERRGWGRRPARWCRWPGGMRRVCVSRQNLRRKSVSWVIPANCWPATRCSSRRAWWSDADAIREEA